MTLADATDSRLATFAAAHGTGEVVVLTGAGISAESGIPTFRGPEGYWTVGSAEYHPQDMATNAMFRKRPEEVWRWYLYRRTVCGRSRPNPAHAALVDLERGLGDRFTLITQNVDGLHLAAGQTLDRTFMIHGNLAFMRCFVECTGDLYPMPDDLGPFDKDTPMTEAIMDRLKCPACQGLARPHVLWFDEMYNDRYFFFTRSLHKAASAGLLVVVGTSGATNLPNQVVATAARSGAAIIDINPHENPFGDLAGRLPRGLACRGPATVFVPALVRALTQAA